MPPFVNKKATLTCTGCPGAPGQIDASKARTVNLCSDTIVVESDKTIAAPGFGTCIIIPTNPRPCQAKLGSWMKMKADVKCKGEHALLFPNTIPCTYGPGVITMTFAGQVPVGEGGSGNDGGNKPCDWQDCDSKHEFKVAYPNDGCVERKSLGDWAHPSALVVFKIHVPTFSAKKTAPAYAYQKHHVIPCAVIKELPKIKENLKLLGFDINNEMLNGISLPADPDDIVWHDLQCHRGPHPQYNMNAARSLKGLEKQVVNFCKTNEQGKLWEEILNKVRQFKEKILSWDWHLRTNTVAERAAAQAKSLTM